MVKKSKANYTTPGPHMFYGLFLKITFNNIKNISYIYASLQEPNFKNFEYIIHVLCMGQVNVSQAVKLLDCTQKAKVLDYLFN